jgi:hypothetical protein
MWTLILILYVTNVNDAELGLVRSFTTEQACEAAASLAQQKVRHGVRFSYLCVPTRT